MDLERLDEALGYMDWLAGVASDWPEVEEHGAVIVNAARAYRDLLANGERVEWCPIHKAPEAASEEPGVCWLYDGDEDCRIVSKVLTDPTTEEEG